MSQKASHGCGVPVKEGHLFTLTGGQTSSADRASAMTGIHQLILTAWNKTETRKFLRIDLSADKFKVPLKRCLEVKNICKVFLVPGRDTHSFRMWPHPHDIVQAWEDGQSCVEVVGAMVSARP